ncbi:MAG: hypothetical protein NTX50_29585 [Candidatus Sumerlaeota bacterium]|nr:hypothetical protein [Candidatus Sumerlaeota bacterium]
MKKMETCEKAPRPLPYELHDPIRRQFECGLYDRLLRYETRSERALYRALDRLQTLQKKRKRKSKPIDISDALEFTTSAPNPPDSQKLKSEGTNPILTGSATGSASILLASHTTQNQHAQDAASFPDPQPSNSQNSQTQNSPNPIEPADLSQ